MVSEPIAVIDQETRRKESGPRFAFGKNWQRFLRYLNDERIAEAEKSLREMLEVEDLAGKTFLDIGSGSGLFSLAAMRLGAGKVHSFDYDTESVACTRALQHRYYDQVGNWTVEQGSVLDPAYLSRLGQFDVVYSWGVLHHTGNMWQALENVVAPVAANGKLFIALYNDQGRRSRVWKAIKRRYASHFAWRPPIFIVIGSYFVGMGLLVDLLRGRNPLTRYREYKRSRGMSQFTDLLDWMGGYPFEVSKPGDVFDFFRKRGFTLVRLKTIIGLGCNEYIFQRQSTLD
ncbi:MAG TPA: class I SAM-dependent methyltransferase [Candidatus Angelobacter sp.]